MRLQQGFSLVELSIVLVILGLLTGGILGGQSLMRAAELRSVTQEINRYQSATHTFRDKYFTLPGDLKNAVAFWGAQTGATTDGVDAACAALTSSSPATSSATCNGDGNGTIGEDATANNIHERYRYWQHLANAGLIEGSYTGVPASATVTHNQPGINVPASKLSQAGYSMVYRSTQDNSGAYFPGYYGHVLLFGTSNTNMTQLPILKAEEAWQIDTKTDDGKPAFGNVVVFKNSSNTQCASTDVTSTAEYRLDQTSNGCPLIFKMGF